MLFIKMLMSICLMTNLGNITSNKEVSIPQPKATKSAYTSIPVINNWVTVPKETKEITIFVEAENTETVLFWLIPTGTQTWWERRLIGYAINKDQQYPFHKAQTYSLKWNIDEPSLHHHLEVELIGMDAVIGGGSINITSE